MTATNHSQATVLTLLVVGILLCSTVSPVLVAGAQSTFTAEVTTYNGQVATEDGAVTVSGQAVTDSDVVVVFLGSSGGVIARSIPVTGERFRARVDIDSAVSEGLVDGYAFSVGSDGAFGTPGDGPDSPDDLVSYAADLESRDLTQTQARDVLLQATTEDSASDDLVVEIPFVLTRGNIQIRDVVAAETGSRSGIQSIPAGEQMIVRGVTNRRPSNVLIDVSVVDGPEADRFTVETVEEWEQDGVWEVTFAVPSDIELGTYTVRADDGDHTASVDVEIVAAPTPESTTATTTEPTTDATTAEPTPEPTPAPTTPKPTETTSPGFGLLATLAAFLALSVLSVLFVRSRRR